MEDIFEATDASRQTPQAPAAPQPAPPIPGPPTALASGKLKPLPATGGAGTPLDQTSGQQGVGFPFKTMFIIVFASVGVIGVAVGAFAVLSGSLAVPFAPKLGSPQDSATVPAAVAPSAVSSVSEQADSTDSGGPSRAAVEPQDTSGILRSFQQDSIDRALNSIPQDLASIDTDQDGLSDAQEFSHGTNPRLVDSDNDGLSDWEEISIFGTDPLNIDSDADSYLDGEEVQNGYNPLGPGKLLNLERTNPAGE